MISDLALNHAKSLQIYFFCVKRKVKNSFVKDIERRVSIQIL